MEVRIRSVLLSLVTAVLGMSPVVGAEAGGGPPAVGPKTTAIAITVGSARSLCRRSHGTRHHVAVRGYLVVSSRIPQTVEVRGALFGHRVARTSASVLPWPPPGGLAVTWSTMGNRRPTGFNGALHEFRWFRADGTLRCSETGAASLTVTALRILGTDFGRTFA